jgi:hypothetical protein
MTYQSTVLTSLGDLYERVLWFLPNLLAAIIVIIFGWLLGSLLSNFVEKILNAIKIDQLANSLGLASLGEKVGKKLSLSALGAWIIKWFFFLGSFIATAEILGLNEVSRFFYDSVLAYGGQVIIAMAILLLGILAANFFSGIVGSSVKASGLNASASALASITKWAIVIFALIASLSQLQIATDFLIDLFRAIVAMIAIAGGIAFGLGGKEHAKKILDEVENGLTKKM